MAGAGSTALAKAVQSAGGLGSLPCATLSLEAIETGMNDCLNRADETNAAIAAQGSRPPLNVNFFTHSAKPENPNAQQRWQQRLADEYHALSIDPQAAGNTKAASRSPFNESACELIEANPPAVVSFHFGLPDAALVKRVKAAGCQVWSSATTVTEAVWLEAHGADAIIAQGFEAGGHRGLFLDPQTGEEITDDHIGLIAHQVGTFSLLPQVVDAVQLPVIAAGGIADGRGIAAALALGASAVQIGTAFLFSQEATITPMHRQALQQGSPENTALTNVFSGKPARSVVNTLMQRVGPMSQSTPPFPTAATALAPLKTQAESENKADYSSLWSGQSAQLANQLIGRCLSTESNRSQDTDCPSATHLVDWLAADATQTLKQLARIS